MCNKANASIAFLRRNLQISQQHIKANAYTTLVRPQVEYAAVVGDPYTQENQHKIEMVQRRAARYVCSNYSRDARVTTMLDQLGWRSLLQWRADTRLVFLYKCINGLVAVDLSSDLTRPTRPSGTADLTTCHSISETSSNKASSRPPSHSHPMKSTPRCHGRVAQPGHLQRTCLYHHTLQSAQIDTL